MAGRLTIVPAETPAERREFVHFQWQVYKGDPYWVPPFPEEREAFLDPQRHPFHQHAQVKYFTARRDGKLVGTIAGIINDSHNVHWNENIGFFGLFEALPDEEAARALLETAEAYVRDAGKDAIRGPVNFSTNEECGLLIDGWDGPPRIMMTYNPRYYADFIDRAGYSKAMDLLAFLADVTHVKPDGTGLNPKILRVSERVMASDDLSFRSLDKRHFDRDAGYFRDIYNQAWSKNWGFIPLTEAEMHHEITALKPILDPQTVFFAFKGDRPIAAGLPLPDLCQALIHAYPRPGVPDWWSTLKMLYWWKVRNKVTILRAFAGGVVEEYRGRGLEAVLTVETMKRAVPRYKQLEFSWVLETNIPMHQTAMNMGGKPYRRYRIYEKALRA